MLETLQTVKWDELETAYGAASPVPQFILNLISQNHDTLREARFDLWSYVCHQGTVYSATRYVVPFLIELLMEPSVIEKEEIVDLLSDIATGGSAVSKDNAWQRQYFKEQGLNFEDALKQATNDVIMARESVNDGFEQYVELLSNQSPIVKIRLVDLLGVLKDIPAKVMPVFLDLIIHEANDSVRAEAIFKSSKYIEDVPKSRHFTDSLCTLLSKLLDTTTFESRSKVAACLSLIQLNPDNHPELCKQAVLQVITNPQDIHPHSEFASLEHQSVYENMIVEDVLDAISHLSSIEKIDFLINMLVVVTESKYAHSIAIMLFGCTLAREPFKLTYRGEPIIEEHNFFYAVDGPASGNRIQTRIYPVYSHHLEIDTLDALAKKSIYAVLNCQVVWKIPSNILQAFGLPEDVLILRNKLLQN